MVTILISQSVAESVGMGIESITINAVLYLQIISIDGINSLGQKHISQNVSRELKVHCIMPLFINYYDFVIL